MKHTATWFLVFAAVAFAGRTVPAAEAAGDELTVDRAVVVALANNAQLKSMQAKTGAMAERPAQAWSLPNPMVSYSGMDMADGGTFPVTAQKWYMVEQAIPWFGKRGLRAEVARKDADLMQRDFDAMTRDVVMMVKESYFELRAVQLVTAITRSEEAVLRRMEKSAEAMNATGQRTQLDVLKAQSEITMLQPKLLELSAKEDVLKAKLNSLMNRQADAPVGTAVTAPVDTTSPLGATLLALAEKTRPEIRGAILQVERAESERQLMAKETKPDYKLGLQYRSIDNDKDMLMFTVGLELPLWGSKNHAQTREAELMLDSSRAALESAKRAVANETWAAQAGVTAARRTLAIYRSDLLPQAESRFRASESAYQTGKADFLDLLESERFLLSVRTMAAMAEGELGMQFARLERAVGADLKSTATGDKP